jgi:5'-nucleotidase
MVILITNDDGIMAEGIAALCSAFARRGHHEVFVAAPDRERSATGHAITMHQPLRVDEVVIPGLTATTSWSVSGTPADCAKLAVKALMSTSPAVVVSGINRGPNVGTDVFYSGTVSAAVEAAMLGIPAIAVSLAAFENLDYGPAAEFAVTLAEIVATHGLPNNTILNVTVPALPAADIAGVAVTKLGAARYEDTFERRMDPRGRAYYWLTGELHTSDEGPNTDVGAIRRNLISVTPMHLDLTHYDFMKALTSWCLTSPRIISSARKDENPLDEPR